MIYKRALAFLFVTLSILNLQANSAMPGFWNNGNGSEFYPLYLADTPYIGKIQMQSEEILIHLYPGFGVVKGTYHMLNPTDKPISIHTGYPINGHVSNPEVFAVHLSDVYGLRVLVNDSAVAIEKAKGDNATISTDVFGYSYNWYVWQMTYAPKSVTTITVYFLVNTQDAQLAHGYDRKHGNAFTYILESGRAWKDSIDEGEIKVFLKGGLKTSDLFGVLPKGQFSGNDTFLYHTFTKLEPTDSDNVVLWFKQLAPAINFDSIRADSAYYFKAMDVAYLQPTGLTQIKAADFETGSTGSFMVGLALFTVIFGPFILLAIILIALVWWWLRRRKRKRLEAQNQMQNPK
ncbi:MAG: hypothetical protein U0V74_05010 [Chitinophagales bacterium]